MAAQVQLSMRELIFLVTCLAGACCGQQLQDSIADTGNSEHAEKRRPLNLANGASNSRTSSEAKVLYVSKPLRTWSFAAILLSGSDCKTLGRCQRSCRSLHQLFWPLACAAAFSTVASLRPRLDAWLDSTLKYEKKRRDALQREADSAKKAERLGRWATLVVGNLYRINDLTENIAVEDWENGGRTIQLSFDLSRGTPREQADAAFSKARKLRRSSAVVATLIEQSHERERLIEEWQARIVDFQESSEDDNTLLVIRKQLLRAAKKLKFKLDDFPSDSIGSNDAAGDQNSNKALLHDSKQQTALYGSKTKGWTGREFVSPAGVPILVGRNRQENQHLSLKLAREPDVWMHVRGAPGAHVLLRMSRTKGKPSPSDQCLQMAADLAAFYSEMRDENKVLVTISSPRHITKPKGAPLGAVKIQKENGTIVALPTKSSLIPADLRELRERERFVGSSFVMSGGGAKRWT